VLTPALSRPLTRRASFRLVAGAALAAAGLTSVTACTPGQDTAETVDTLTTHLRQARQDARSAAALAASIPDRAAALSVVELERTAHADALATEIDRVAGGSTTTPAASVTTDSSGPPPTWDELVAALTDSARSAADSARNESGFRAGLLGSISAACTTSVEVVLS
jgi:hypothetical protein